MSSEGRGSSFLCVFLRARKPFPKDVPHSSLARIASYPIPNHSLTRERETNQNPFCETMDWAGLPEREPEREQIEQIPEQNPGYSRMVKGVNYGFGVGN